MITLEEAKKRLDDACAYLHVDEKQALLANLDAQIAQPDFWNDTDHAQCVSKQASDIRDLLDRYEQANQLLEDASTAHDFMEEDASFEADYEQALTSLEQLLDAFEIESWFTGRYDGADAIVSIHPGSGGLEAQDWTEMLYRMYSRYVDSKGWKLKVLDLVPVKVLVLITSVSKLKAKTLTVCYVANQACIAWFVFLLPMKKSAVILPSLRLKLFLFCLMMISML